MFMTGVKTSTWQQICRQVSWFMTSETFMMCEIYFFIQTGVLTFRNTFAKNPYSNLGLQQSTVFERTFFELYMHEVVTVY